MLLSRRFVSAAVAARAVTPRTTQSLARFYSTETAASTPAPAAAAAATPPAEAPEKSSSSSSSPSSTQATPAAKTTSKWVKPKPAFAATTTTTTTAAARPLRSASTNSRSITSEQPPTYEPTTIAHLASNADAADNSSSSTVSDWANSFHGISTKPVSEEQFKMLMAPIDFKDIEVKPDGVIYLPEIKYRRKLNETFGPMGWGLIPKGEAVVGNAIVTREYALIADGRFVSQAQGENGYFSPEQLPSAVEGCKSNALMRCCKDLGIASELWDPHYVRWFRKAHMEEVWVEHATTKKKRTFWYRKGQVDVAYPYKLTK
ncbi:hypothetical protein E4U21_002298 [Claviceps maximensis]|nr:hypothetical protein E4U21_002298 [Claviceps maximensis]